MSGGQVFLCKGVIKFLVLGVMSSIAIKMVRGFLHLNRVLSSPGQYGPWKFIEWLFFQTQTYPISMLSVNGAQCYTTTVQILLIPQIHLTFAKCHRYNAGLKQSIAFFFKKGDSFERKEDKTPKWAAKLL